MESEQTRPRLSTAMIVYVSSFDVTRPDGPGVNEQMFVLALARILKDDVRFVIPEPSGELPDGFPEERCLFLPNTGGRKAFKWVWHQVRKYFVTRQLLKAKDVEFLVFRPDVFPLADLAITSNRKVRFCLKNANVSRKAQHTKGLLRGNAMRVHYALLERLYRRADLIDVVSSIQREDILDIPGIEADRVIVTDNAVDCEIFKVADQRQNREALGLPKRGPIFGYVGNLAETRGGAELVRALPSLRERYPDANVLIVEGDGRSKDSLLALGRDLGVEEHIEVRGPVPLSEVPAYLNALDVAVSLRDDDGCSELKVRQYIACGCPAVVSARVNQFVHDEDLGTLVTRGDQEALQAALLYWADRTADPAERAELKTRLSNYARSRLDTVAVNRNRIGKYRAAVQETRRHLAAVDGAK